jgi:two-component system chemotaxis response regulator CheY
MTANSEASEKAKCLAAGMDDFITKPVKASELDALIKRIFAKTETGSAELQPDSPIDVERLREALGHDLSSLIQLYLSETAQGLEQLGAAIQTGNAADIEMIAHNCAGTSANCGIVGLVEPARALEKAGREQHLEDCPVLLEELRSQLRIVDGMLQQEINNEKSVERVIEGKKRILLIDDQQVIANVYRSKLENEGFAVEIASDGQQGLEKILETKPDLVLLDWNLPKLSGLHVLKQVRAKLNHSEMPIVVLSISSFAPMVEEAKRAGANMVLSKTQHSPNMVVELINTFVAPVAA